MAWPRGVFLSVDVALCCIGFNIGWPRHRRSKAGGDVVGPGSVRAVVSVVELVYPLVVRSIAYRKMHLNGVLSTKRRFNQVFIQTNRSFNRTQFLDRLGQDLYPLKLGKISDKQFRRFCP